MSANRSIERSRRLYERLLYFFPKEHRLEYGPAMSQLFTDQCREARNEGGWTALLALWVRTFLDLGKSALIEHFATSEARTALLEALPGQPLPWKGVFLVAIPGLVVFIGQLGQLAGKNWYFSTLAWAGYAFLVPALLVWWRARKFPVWGLVPLGLLLQQLTEEAPFYLRVFTNRLDGSSLKNLLAPLAAWGIDRSSLWVPLACAILLAGAAVWIVRRSSISSAARRWFVIFFLIVGGRLATDAGVLVWGMLKPMPRYLWSNVKLIEAIARQQTFNILAECSYDAYLCMAFLLLVLVGVLLARRHGPQAFLLLLGYLLPTVLYGTSFWGGTDPSFLVVGSMVFIYRLSVAIVAPLWIVRSASKKQQVWAVMVPILIALAAQLVVPFSIRTIFTAMEFTVQPVLSGLTILAGSVLAWALYRSAPPEAPVEAPPRAAAGQLAAR